MPGFPSPFPADVGFGAAEWQDAPELLFPEEHASLSPRAVAKRRAEFVAGRVAARAALEALGRPPVAIPKDEDRAPRWPDDVVGAITHSAGWALAAAGPATRYLGLGLDLERVGDKPNLALGDYFTDATEQGWIAGDFRRMITAFSAKEAVYKALYAHHGDYFGYSAVTLRPRADGLVATLNQPLGDRPAGSTVDVRVDHRDNLVLTSVCLLRGGSTAR